MTKKRFDTKKIPSLAEWLGDGARADGYEEWVRDTLFIDRAVASAEAEIGLRMIRTLTVACVEVMRQERERGEFDSATALQCLARAAGVAVSAPILCMLRDDADNIPGLALVLSAEFGHGITLILPEEGAAQGGGR